MKSTLNFTGGLSEIAALALTVRPLEVYEENIRGQSAASDPMFSSLTSSDRMVRARAEISESPPVKFCVDFISGNFNFKISLLRGENWE